MKLHRGRVRAMAVERNVPPLAHKPVMRSAAPNGRAQRERLARLVQLFEAVPEAILALDADGVVSECNAAALRLLGCERACVTGTALLSLAAPAARPALHRAIVRAFEGSDGRAADVVFETPSGRSQPLVVLLAPMRSDDGSTTGAAGVLRVRALLSETQDMLWSSEARVHDLIENAPEGIFVADARDRYTEINRAACELLGLRREEIIGRQLCDLTSPESWARIREARARLAASGAFTTEWTFKRVDGQVFYLDIRGRMLPDGSWHAFVRDVTAYKNAAERAARAAEHEHRIRSRVEAVESACTEVERAAYEPRAQGVESVLQSIADQAVAITRAGCGAAGAGIIRGMPIEQWATAGARADLARAFGDAPAATGVLDEILARGRALRVADLRAHGGCLDATAPRPAIRSFLGVPIRMGKVPLGIVVLGNKEGADEFTEEDQRAVEMLVSHVVGTLHAAREIQSEASERAWLESVIEYLPDGVVVFDRDGRRISINRAAVALVNDREGTRDATATLDAIWPDGRQVPPEEMPAVRTLATGEPFSSVEMYVRTALGDRVPVMVNSSPITTRLGQRLGVVVVLRDISVFKEVERLRDEWSALVAHELKQPLGQIAIWAELLLRRISRSATEADIQPVEQIRSGVRRMDRMVGDLLDASRIEARRLQLCLADVDVAALLRNAVERATCADDSSPVRIEVSERLPVIQADASRLDQVLDNLISNAFKYGRRGAAVVVGAHVAGSELVIEVTNAGAGLSRDEQLRLFQRFYRAEHTRKSGVAGSGLGLHIARGIIEAHGGRIWVESVPGESTTFSIALPIALANGLARRQ